jgi:putative transposase
MNLSKSFKYRLKLKPCQEQIFSQWSGCCRFVYNRFLDQRIKSYEQEKKTLSYVDQANQLPELKKELVWLKEPPSQSLQHVLRDLDQAFKNFFRRVKQGGEAPGFPKFKKKGFSDSFRLPEPKQFFVSGEGRKGVVKLPKVGEIRFIRSREIEGKIRNATISKSAGKWYISFNCEVEKDIPINPGTGIGIDRGVTHTLMTSEGKVFDLPKEPIAYWEGRLIQAQRKLSRMHKKSNNWKKQKQKVGKLHHKITNIRNDFLHKSSTEIAKNHSYVVLEELKTKNMTGTAKGTIENPGKNVKAKAGLNKAILMQGWHKFQTLVEYKSIWHGSIVEYVKPEYTSQRCFKCGHVARENRKQQSMFKCVSCGHTENADLNAAKNIYTDGLSGRACGVAS